MLSTGVKVRSSRVITSFLAVIRDIEAFVHPDDDVKEDHDYFNGKVENVETRFVLVNSGIARRTFPASEICTHAERRSCAKEDRGYEEKYNLPSEAAMTKFLNPRRSWNGETTEDQQNGKERDDGVEGLAIEKDVSINAFGVQIQGVEALNDGNDEHDQGNHDEAVDGDEAVMKDGMPARIWMASSHYSLSKDDVDDEQQNDAGIDEDIGGNGDAGVGYSCGPDDAHDHGDYSGHAEAEQHAGDDEFVSTFQIDL